MSGFVDHPSQLAVGQAVEVLVSTEPVELQPATVTALTHNVDVVFTDGARASYRPWFVRPATAAAPGQQLDLFGVAS